MRYFLDKTDPETYSLADLEHERRTVWDGVKNPQALRAVRSRPGDHVFLYHSGGAPSVVGLARVASEPRPDPGNAKLAVVDFEFLTRLEPPTSLTEIRQSDRFSDWALIRQARLSTMPAPEAFVGWMRGLYPGIKI